MKVRRFRHMDPYQSRAPRHAAPNNGAAVFRNRGRRSSRARRKRARVTLHSKEDAHDHLHEEKTKEREEVCAFIHFLFKSKRRRKFHDEDGEEENLDDVEPEHDKEKHEEEGKKPTKDTVYQWEQVNTQKAIWLRAKGDVTEEECNHFYKGISNSASILSQKPI